MKKWLRNILIAGGVLVGSLKGFSQNADENFTKYLSDSNNWKNYELNEGIKQPKYCDSAKFEDFLDTAKWPDYEVQQGLEQPVYNSADSVQKQELPSFKEMQKKLGIKYITEVKNLGHGYVTSKPEYSSLGEGTNYNDLKKISGLKKGSVKLFYDGRKGYLEGKLMGEPSEKILDEIDVSDDYIITNEEVSDAMNSEYRKAFLKYASKELGVPESEIVFVGKNFVTSKDLEKKLNEISENYENHFEKPRETLYEHMGNDAVLTEDEISATEEVLEKYL